MLSKNMLAAVVLGMGSVCGLGALPALAMEQKIINVPANSAQPGRRGLFNDVVLPSGASRYGKKGAGISMAQQKRASLKKRNIKRSKKHA